MNRLTSFFVLSFNRKQITSSGNILKIFASAVSLAVFASGLTFAPQAAYAVAEQSPTQSCSAYSGGVDISPRPRRITVAPGDVVTLNVEGLGNLQVKEMYEGDGPQVKFIDQPSEGMDFPKFGSVVLQSEETKDGIEVYIFSGGSKSLTITESNAGTYSTYFYVMYEILPRATLSCTPASVAAEAEDKVPSVEEVQEAFTSTQMVAQTNNLYNIMSRNVRGSLEGGGAGPQVSQNAFFFSSASLVSDMTEGGLNFWATGRYVDYNGDSFEGYQADLVFGLDKKFNGNFVVGGLIGYDTSDFNIDLNAGTRGSLEAMVSQSVVTLAPSWRVAWS